MVVRARREAEHRDAVAHGIRSTAGVVTSRGRADRRDHRPGGAAAGDDEAARRLELVSAELARLAARFAAEPQVDAARA